MKPVVLINKYVESYLVNELKSYGYSYSASKIRFRKNIDKKILGIDFWRSKWNKEDVLSEFWIDCGINSTYYSKWVFDRYGIKKVNDNILGIQCHTIKGWDKTGMNRIHRYNLVSDNPDQLMNIIKNNFLNILVPFLENYTSWKRAADTILKQAKFKQEYIKASDFYILSDLPEKGFEPLLIAKEYLMKKIEEDPHPNFYKWIDEIDMRLKINYNVN